MPEGPELHLASRFVNKVCKGRVFSGKVNKSKVSTKNPDVPWDAPQYTIHASSRGKEIKLFLESKNNKNTEQLTILFRFGMSGKFRFDHKSCMHKHAHLNFFSQEDDMVLSFTDFRRFGRWEVNSDWGKARGPCVLQEYELFRNHVLENLNNPAFNRPICEALLNQKFFNGIGNYLRAEILFKCGIRPFDQARDVLQRLLPEENGTKSAAEIAQPDILQLCHVLPSEVINLSGGKGYDPEASAGDDYSAFADWLQCYYNKSMRNMVDNNKRTIWFSGDPGPMAPKQVKIRNRKTKTHLDKKGETENDEESKSVEKPTRAKVAKLAGKKRKTSEKPKTSPKIAIKKEEAGEPEAKKTKQEVSRPKRGRKSSKRNGSENGVSNSVETLYIETTVKIEVKTEPGLEMVKTEVIEQRRRSNRKKKAEQI